MRKTLEDLVEDYVDYRRSLNYAERTLLKGRENLVRFVDWLADHAHVDTVDQLRKVHLEKWHRSLPEWRTRDGYPLKPSGLNRHIVSVRGFIAHLVRQGLLPKRFLQVLLYIKEPRRLPGHVLTHAQMRKLLSKIPTDSAPGYRNRTMLELLYSSGIRSAELLALDVDDINLDHRVALIHGKGRKERMVPIGTTAMRYLETYIKAVRPFLVCDSREKAVFLNERRQGKRLSYQVFRRIVKACAELSGLDVPVTAHTFRRSCTTELIRGGANVYHVKELLGHESLDTLNHYAKLTINDLKKTHAKTHPREKDT